MSMSNLLIKKKISFCPSKICRTLTYFFSFLCCSKPPRAEIVVSPRKRILREIEKDKLVVSDNSQKRSRGKLQSTNTSFASVGKSSMVNGLEDNVYPVPRNCGYSITSLLTEDYIPKKTPSNSPNHNSSLSQPLYRSPISEDRWYSESVDRLRSIEINVRINIPYTN